ncbi:MAG: glycosyltransferase [Candidatus Thorarchaeota archaeon]|nr:glycosyltransferase [Candidatus Thorarchaeota archaeon]
MREVLFIAYFYPPLGSVGSVRPLQFSKYLPEYGWRSSVLSVKNDGHYPNDLSMLASIPRGQKIARSYRLPIFSTLGRIAKGPLRRQSLLYSFLDAQYDWVPDAIRTGKKLIKEGNYEAIIATAPPYSALRVARALNKIYKIPIIADLRDPYTTNEFMKWPTKCHKKFYSLYERKLLASFDHLITTNESHSVDLSEKLGQSEERITMITNGYDPDDFSVEMRNPPNDRFVFGYVGSIYGKVSPRPFFESLNLALKQRPEMRELIDVVFVGNMQPKFVKNEARRMNVDDLISIRGFVPHFEALSFIHQCHVLVQFGGMVSRSFPAKIFEYAASGHPTLSFDNPEVFGDFITRNGLGTSVNGLKPEEGATKIIEFLDMFKRGEQILGPSTEDSQRFSRRILTADLASVLKTVVDS